MGGGLMQLVAYGAQDIYLTGNPQITFFKVVYRRHTNFAMETVEQTLSGNSTSSTSTVSCTATVSRNGDLVGKMYVTSSSSNITDGDEIVNQVDVEIGGQRIDRHYKEWMQVWAELSTPDSKALAYKNMTGALSHGLNKTGGSGAGVNMVQIPLQFWFCRNPGLALPLIALQYHEVKLKLTLGTSSDIGDAASVKLWADYIYLDTDERRRFSQVSHEYLIEQLQRETTSSATSHTLNFNHPVKELVWTSAATNVYETAKLQLNGHDRFAAQEEEYFQLRQPMDHHTAVPGTNIPMSDRPVMVQPKVIAYRDTGTATGTTENTLHNTIGETSGTKTTFSLLIGTNFIANAAASNYPKVGDLLDVEIRDHSEIAAGYRRRNVVVQVTSVASQTDGWNIGVELEDGNEAIANTFVVGTNNDDMVSISIVARLQDPLSRCSQLTKKINCYSFALKPEEHQPSGTCNFSRIDNAKLLTTFADSLNIYAVNYNVLRVMSGMGGLAYSN